MILTSCTSYQYYSKNELNKQRSIKETINQISYSSLDSASNNIFKNSALYLFYHIKEQYGSDNWEQFQNQVSLRNQTIEKQIMAVYDKTLYQIGADIHYNTEYPFPYPTNYDVLQTGFVNIQFNDSISYQDRNMIEYLFDNYCKSIESILLKDSLEKELFYEKLHIMNNRYIDISLMSNQSQIELNGLKYSTARTYGYYKKESQNFEYNVSIQSKYINPISSITFLHELVHAVIRIKEKPLSHFKISRNNTQFLDSIINQKNKNQVMLEEGLAEYISRNFSVWKSVPIFESIHSELQFLQEKESMPWLSLLDMEAYYYGEEKKSFTYVEYGLTSAHSLVHFLIKKYSVSHVLKIISYEDIEKASLIHLKKPWYQIMMEWKETVSNEKKI